MSPRSPIGQDQAGHPTGSWQGCSASELERAWSIPRVELYRSVGSTNDVARTLAAAGAPEGTVVIAEEQTSGRGRAGRRWASAPGLGLWLSMVMRPSAGELPALPIRVALAVAETLDTFLPASAVEVKWPNDVVVEGRKLAGILCEAAWNGPSPEHAVAGVGINLLHKPEDFTAEIRAGATSVFQLGGYLGVFEIASAVVLGMRRINLTAPSPRDWEERIRPRDYLLGRSVEILDYETGVRRETGAGTGITADGALRLTTRTGEILVRSGTARPLDDGDADRTR